MPEKTRILFVITQSEIGGAQQFLIQFLNNLDPARFEMMVISGTSRNHDLEHELPDTVKYQSSRHLVRDLQPIQDLSAVFELKTAIKTHRPDILFLMSSKAGFLGSLAARLLKSYLPNMHVVYRIGGWAFNDPRPDWQKSIYRALERFSAPWKDTIVVNSTKDLRDATRFHIHPRRRVSLIHNGIDPHIEMLDQRSAREQLNDTKNDSIIRIGTIANFYPTKGLSYLISAMAKLPGNTELTIIGDGHLRSTLEEQIKNLGLQARVKLAGTISRAHRLLPAFDIFVLPSLKEGFPWAILEAMAARLAIVATDVGAVPEVLTSGKNGLLVSPGDPAALAAALTTLVGDKPLRQQLGAAAHETLVRSFSLDHMLEQYHALLIRD